MFLRIKKIGGKEYAYIVENSWRKKATENGKKGARQKVKGYLGRVYSFESRNDMDFFEHYSIADIEEYIGKNKKNRVVEDLVKWEISRHDISGFSIDFGNNAVKKDDRDVCIKINEGFLCSHTLNNLMEFKADGDEREVGFKLAKAFVDAGIEVPKELFVGLFGKVFR